MFRDEAGELLYCYEEFFDALESIRVAWDRPMTIGSGYRCPAHNKAIGGEPMSVHQFGLAVDVTLDTVDEVHEFVKLARDVAPSLRKGWKQYLDKGQTFVHLDNGMAIYPRPSSNFREGVEW